MTADSEGSPPWYDVEASRVVYEGFSRVRVDTVAMPDGTHPQREVVEHTSAVAIVPLLADDTVVLLRQYRHAAGRYLLEIPAGMMDVDGEAPEATAHRELAEEIGMQAGRLDHLTTFANSAGWCTERTHVWLGRDLEDVPPPDGFVAAAEEADMEVVRLPVAAATAAIRSGQIVDAKTIIGVLLAQGV